MMLCAENTFDPNRGLAELRKSAPTNDSTWTKQLGWFKVLWMKKCPPYPAKTAGRVKIISGIHKIAQPSNLSNTTYLICKLLFLHSPASSLPPYSQLLILRELGVVTRTDWLIKLTPQSQNTENKTTDRLSQYLPFYLLSIDMMRRILMLMMTREWNDLT